MSFSSRKLIVGFAAALAVMVPAGLAWGCVALVSFKTVGNGVVAPGGTVEVFGGAFARGKPVSIRLDSPDGPVLATYANPLPSTMTSQFQIPVPIPADIRPGAHVLFATQDHYDMNVGIPARASIYVGTSAPVAEAPVERTAALAVGDGPGAGGYVLIGLGVAAAGLLLAAVASAVVSKRPTGDQPESVKA